MANRSPVRARRLIAFVVVAIFVALGISVLTRAPAAHAFDVCVAGCSVRAVEDDYTVTYSSASQSSLHRTAAQGVLANDSGPSTTIVDLQDTPDTPGTHLVTTLNGFTVTINNDGSFTYYMDGTFSGVDSFDYFTWDSKDHLNFDSNTVYITIVPTLGNDIVRDPFRTHIDHLAARGDRERFRRRPELCLVRRGLREWRRGRR